MKRLRCRRGCVDCCIDAITVFEIEAENIRRHHGELLQHAAPHAPGRCAFLDDAGSCRIYPLRPYVCHRQGLPLRWIDDDDPRQPVERRDICPLNIEGEPLEHLAAEHCWTLGAVEGRLAQLQAATRNGTLTRVALRALFAKP